MADRYIRPDMRLRGWDYRHPGGYFVTINLRDRHSRFGSVTNGVLKPSEAGEMIASVWQSLPDIYPMLILDAFIVMPDHLHGLLFLHNDSVEERHPELSTVIRIFKSITTSHYIAGVKADNWPRFDLQLWQSNYYDHVIRNERDLENRRLYIERNPGRWWEKRRPGM